MRRPTESELFGMRVAVAAALRRAEDRRLLVDEGVAVPELSDRERIEDRILAMVLEARNEREVRSHRHLRVLDGGSEGSVVGRRPGPEDAASVVVGGKPSRVASAQPETHPTDLTGLGQGEPGEATSEGIPSSSLSLYAPPAPTTSTEGES